MNDVLCKEMETKINDRARDLEKKGNIIKRIDGRDIYFKTAEGKDYYVEVGRVIKEVTVMENVIATDEKGNEFEKTVTVYRTCNNKPTLNFGGYCQYYLESIEKERPFTKPLCIDIMGRNHRGVPGVQISAEYLNKIFDKIDELRKNDTGGVFR